MKAKLLVAASGVVLVASAVAYYSLCACVSLVEVAQGTVRREIGRTLDAEQRFFRQHGRFAPTLADLGHVPDSAVSLRLVAASDSAISISGTAVAMAEVTCTLDVTPSTRGVEELQCTR